MSLLTVKNLKTSFDGPAGQLTAVDGVNFSIEAGECLGLVGESGCGKSVTSLSILKLFHGNRNIEGEILFEGIDLLKLDEKGMRKIRGNKISMIFQEPMSSLNPVYTIGNQIAEVFSIHQNLSRKQARLKSIEMLKLVQIPAAEQRFDEYPHQLSGGMRQRVMIAMALACKPRLLIADEPTTALDVTIQAQILKLIAELQQEFKMAVLLITHDLGVVASVCDRVLVMYAGKIVEEANVQQIFQNAGHPYTQGLLKSIPRLGKKSDHLSCIKGMVPRLGHYPSGCRFQDRCDKALDICRKKEPPLKDLGEGQKALCFLSGEVS